MDDQLVEKARELAVKEGEVPLRKFILQRC